MTRTSAAAIVALFWSGLLISACPTLAAAQLGQRTSVQPATAQGFAQQIVARLNDRSETWGVPDTTVWYDPVWLRLVRDNEALAQSRHVESLYAAAAICQCEDESGRYQLLSTSLRRDGRAEARLRFSPEESDPITYTVVLTRLGGGWRIHDVVSNGYSTRAFLTAHVACLRAARTNRGAQLCSAARSTL